MAISTYKVHMGIIGALALLVSVAFAASVFAHVSHSVDQDNSSPANNGWLNLGPESNTLVWGQTFTPSENNLSGIDIIAFANAPVGSDFTRTFKVRVYTGTGGAGTQIGEANVTATLPWESNSTNPETVHFDFASPMTITPGNTHMFAVAMNGTTGDIGWLRTSSGYAGGVVCAVFSPGPSGNCTAQAQLNDTLFRTYFIDNAPPTADAGGPYFVDEGVSVLVAGLGSDPDDDPLTFTWDLDNNGSFETAGQAVTFSAAGRDGPDTQTVVLQVCDPSNACATSNATVNIVNVAPTVTLNGLSSANEGDTNSYSFTTSDPGEPDTFTLVSQSCGANGTLSDATFDLTGAGGFDCTFPEGSSNSTVSVQVADDDLANSNTDSFVVAIANVAPTVSNVQISATSIDENDSATLTGDITDPGADSFTLEIDWDDETAVQSISLPIGTTSFSVLHQYLDDNPTGTPSDVNAVIVTVVDDDGDSGTGSTSITVDNRDPVISGVTGPMDPLALGTPAAMLAEFTDVGTQDSHTCTFSWDDLTANDSVAASGGSCATSHIYAAAGVYTVGVTVTDDDTGTAASAFEFVVVYDPSAGFVTGGGQIDSPEGAYTADLSLSGKATFGFVAKYKKGATTPDGQTEFQFTAGDLNFHSTAYDWLVVAGPQAKFKGTGTINGAGEFGFMLTARDGEAPGGGGVDRFRIKIWELTPTEDIVYDNELGSADDADAATAISGGSIVVHN